MDFKDNKVLLCRSKQINNRQSESMELGIYDISNNTYRTVYKPIAKEYIVNGTLYENSCFFTTFEGFTYDGKISINKIKKRMLIKLKKLNL